MSYGFGVLTGVVMAVGFYSLLGIIQPEPTTLACDYMLPEHLQSCDVCHFPEALK
jgi:hypothetical protein